MLQKLSKSFIKKKSKQIRILLCKLKIDFDFLSDFGHVFSHCRVLTVKKKCKNPVDCKNTQWHAQK